MGLIAYVVLCITVPFSAAMAHAILLDSRPGLNDAVPEGETRIVLRFNSRIDAGRSRLILAGQDRAQAPLPIAPGSQADVLTAVASLTPGQYTLRWQVLALDGHIPRGEVPFTVRAQRSARAE